ncbi:hypothetical protein N665_0579s0006 [Sinapis alba]|nr:hypothetical protein N665_0579s0006 [Sinapis alba]
MASSSSSSCSKPPQDQVFINFRGDELRCNFVSHLYNALKRKKINVFIDKNEKKGQQITSLLERIEGSKIAVAIFSPRYTEAKWCLKELAKMKERMEEGKLEVIPIFYKVDPDTVDEQKGEFGDKFRNLVKIHKEEENKWTEALKYFAKLHGCVLPEKSDESHFIAEIVEHVLEALNNPSGYSSSNPPLLEGSDLSRTVHQKNVESSCGIELRLKQLEEKISVRCGETTRIIGVVGPPGIGKSTLVKKFYEESKNLFLSKVFIQDVHQTTKEDNGLCYLLKVLLEDLLDLKNPTFETVQAAREVYDVQPFENKAFVVLDNVSDREQIVAVLGQRNWIKDGSKIVIATSDKSLIHGLVDDIYEVPRLSYEDSLQHFTHYAFCGQSYASSFLKLSKDFVHYTKGNPLALKVLGAELLGKEKLLWSEKLNALSQYRNSRERSSKKMLAQSSSEMLQSVWKGSYDALNQQQKDTLLDIASCFRSLDENYVARLLDSYGDARREINELVHKFLITISGGKIEMHDTLHMFCEKLGQEASATDGNEQLRLWDNHKIIVMLGTNKGASRIRSIFLDLDDVNVDSFKAKTFFWMKNLRYLKIYSTRCPQECARDIILNFPEGLQLPLGELRCLHWLKFPLKELPQDFHPKNLVDLKLPYSKIEKVWDGDKDASKLKWIDFNHSEKLHTLSGLAEARNLQELNLEGCRGLETLPEDMKNMKFLVFLNLRGCTSLKRLPKINLISLRILILTDCSLFEEFHVISVNLEAIYLDGTAIKKLPDDIGNLQILALLNMKGCKKLKTLADTFGELKALQELILSGCSKLTNFPKDHVKNMERLEILLLDETAIKEMPNIPSLRRIRLSRNEKICVLPEISDYSRLKWFDMKYCKSVTHLPTLPPSLLCFDAHGCSSLRTVAKPFSLAMATENIHSTFIFTNCNGLEQAAKEEIASFAQRKCQLLPSALKLCNKDLVHEISFSACFPGAEIPSWFSHEAIGSKVQFESPQHWNYNKISGIALCAVVSFQNCQDQTRTEQEHTNYLSVKFTCEGITGEEPWGQITWKVGSWNEQRNKREAIESDHVFIGYTNCVHLIKKHEAKKSSQCAPSVAFLEFSVTDENTSGEARVQVLKSGFSFVFEPDEKKNLLQDANSVASTSGSQTPRTNGGLTDEANV